MVLFLAISGAVFPNTAMSKVSAVLPKASPAELSDLVVGTSSQTFNDLPEAQKSLVIKQITDAIRSVWLLFLVAAAISFILSLGIRVSVQKFLQKSCLNLFLTDHKKLRLPVIKRVQEPELVT